MLYLCQVVEVKKLTKFLSQLSLGDYSIRHEFKALLFHLGKREGTPINQFYHGALRNKLQKCFFDRWISTCRGWMTWMSSETGSPGSRSLRRVVHMSSSSRQEMRSCSANHRALRNYNKKTQNSYSECRNTRKL